MMLTTRNHKSMKIATSRSHPMRRQSEKSKPNQNQSMYPSSLRAEVFTADETLKRLFALEIEKSGVVTTAGYNAVFANFLQSQVVTNAVKKREDEKNLNAGRQDRKSVHPFRSAADNLRKSITSTLIPLETDMNEDDVNIAPRKSIILTRVQQEQLLQYSIECQEKAEKQRLIDSFLASYRSKDEDDGHESPSAGSSNNHLTSKIIEVKEIEVADGPFTDGTFERTDSSSSLQLKDIFEEIDSDDDETSWAGSSYTSSSSSHLSQGGVIASSPTNKRISSNGKGEWLPWPVKNDGENLLVSFPSFSGGNGSSSFLAWPQESSRDEDESWERHDV